jgi:hypothetical protein
MTTLGEGKFGHPDLHLIVWRTLKKACDKAIFLLAREIKEW